MSDDKATVETKEISVFGEKGTLVGVDFGSELDGLNGLGYSERQEDSLVPILAILQDNSAEVKRQHTKYIDGAKSGNLIIRSLGKVIDTETIPVAIQFCAFDHVYVQWQGEPGEGVPVARYPFDDLPETIEEKPDPQDPSRMIKVAPNGDRVVDTREHYGHINWGDGWFPIVVPMAGTNHTVSRSLTATLKNTKLPNGAKAPAWFQVMRLSTKFNQRGSQSWFNYEIKWAGWCTDASLRQLGRDLFESVNNKTITTETVSVVDENAHLKNDAVTDEDCPI